MSKVIYTAIFNNYDSLKRPKYINEDYDYVLFTDEITLEAQKFRSDSIFKIKVMPDIKNHKDRFIKSKDIKINPEKYLSEYDSSIYVDGSFVQVGNIEDFLCQSKHTYQMCYHPRRICVYEEAEVCARQKLGNMNRLEMQINRYKAEGFPRDYGLCMGGIIARTHNKKSKRINSAWWDEISVGSTRDQLSIPYVLWKLKEEIGLSPYDNGIDSVFKLNPHL